MSDRKYWTRRAVRYERDWNKRCAETVEKRLARHYEKTLTEIKNDILQLYATFAKDNGLDFNEARRALSSREFREWRMSVSEYLEANDAGLTRELNTLAMRPRITRLEKLYGETLQELDKLGRKVDDDVRNFLSDAYKANYSRDIFDLVKVGGLAVALAKVDSPSVEKVLAARWSGKNYSQRIWTNTRLLSGVVRETIATGIHRGLSIPQLSRMVEDKMHGGYSNAVRLVRTEMNFVNNQAHADSMSAAGIGWYEFIAVLDNRTSAPCRSRDGEAYPLEEKSVGFNYPPLHPRCRSTVAPYIEGASRRGTRIAKVDKDTIQIPASMSYRDYEAVYVKKTQTFEQWQAGKSNKSATSLSNTAKNGTINQAQTNPVVSDTGSNLKDKIEPLRKKLALQKISNTPATEMEKTVKAAGKLVVEEVKKLKIYDVPAAEKIDIPLLDKTFVDFDRRVRNLNKNTPELPVLRNILRTMDDELIEFIFIKEPLQQFTIFRNRAKQMAGLLSTVRDMATSNQTIKQFKTRSMLKPMMCDVLSNYPATWVENSLQKGTMRLRCVPKRGYYDSDKELLACTNIGFDTGVHEFGHRFEHAIERLKEMERAFYERRTKGDKLEKLRDLIPEAKYDKKELTRKDKFLDAYMGKDYGGQAYELVSMGFEYAYTNPTFLLQDEDMAEWIFGLLAIF